MCNWTASRNVGPILDIFEITPDFDLNIMKNKQDLFDINTKV